MPNLQPLTQIRIASDWRTELARPSEWVTMEEDPMPIVKQLVAFFVLEALLKMREPR